MFSILSGGYILLITTLKAKVKMPAYGMLKSVVLKGSTGNSSKVADRS